MSSKPSSGPSKTRSSTSRTRKAPSTRTKTARTGTDTGMEQAVDEAVQDAPAAPARKTTTRRRTTTTRKKAATPDASVASEETPVTDDTAPAVEKPKRTTRRRTTSAKAAVTEAATPEHDAPASSAGPDEAPAEKPVKRTRRKAAAKPAAGTDDAAAEDTAPATADEAESPAPARTRKTTTRSRSTTSKAATTKKTTASRSTKARKDEAGTTASSATDLPGVAAEETPASKPAKATRTRRKKAEPAAAATSSAKTESEDAQAATVPADEAPAAKPVRRRATTRKKAVKEAEAPSPATAIPAEAVEEDAPAKPVRRRRTTKKAEPKTEEATAPAEHAAAPSSDEETGPKEETDSTGETDTGNDELRFSDLALSAPLLKAVEEMGYTHPTPIQAQAIPEILAGHDVLGVAQTGTGKTASFTLPLLEKLSKSRARARMPRSLILEPTRELALQVAENFEQYGAHLRLTHALLIGGGKMNEQRELLNRGVDVLIATPGRLLDMFERGGLLMTQTDLLVIDEADRMLDMGFIPDIERIVSLLPRRRQTLFFSATMAPEIRRLADNFLNHPKEITVARQSSVASTITEGLLVVEKKNKNRALSTLLRQDDVQNAIVFCNRKRDVDALQSYLTRQKFAVGHLHGDLTQSLRFETLEKFRAGELKILVCSDVAARGIDIGGLSHVFNYDLPFNAEDYVHRIGRTGRAGKEGKAYSLATPDEHKLLEAVETLTGKAIEPLTLRGFPSLDWRDEEAEAPAQLEKRKRGRKETTGKKASAPAHEAVPAEPEPRPARRKQAERNPMPEARKHDHRRSGRAELLPPVPEKNGLQDGFGENVPAFMKVSFVPGPRDPSGS